MGIELYLNLNLIANSFDLQVTWIHFALIKIKFLNIYKY